MRGWEFCESQDSSNNPWLSLNVSDLSSQLTPCKTKATTRLQLTMRNEPWGIIPTCCTNDIWFGGFLVFRYVDDTRVKNSIYTSVCDWLHKIHMGKCWGQQVPFCTLQYKRVEYQTSKTVENPHAPASFLYSQMNFYDLKFDIFLYLSVKLIKI